MFVFVRMSAQSDHLGRSGDNSFQFHLIQIHFNVISNGQITESGSAVTH